MSFYANYGYHPKLHLLNISEMKNPVVKDLASRLSKLQRMMKIHLQEAQDCYKTSIDTLCKESPPFKVVKKIWLFRCNIKTTRSCDKLDNCQLRPFPILKQINPIAF